MARRITGLQRQVLHTYKRALEMIRTKPLHTRPMWFAFVSHQFRSPSLGGGLCKKDVGAIEYYLRRADKMLDAYEQPSTTSVGVTDEMQRSVQGKLGWVCRQPKEATVDHDAGLP
ncbi:BQ2448_291 [Microbotryum intermedium]|uniref:BQ2448_291 protein n=1 Tax=Microbotryum intermedium TaxID=269621 RepID=A0A238F215_9BASI|nr:BQ2448_291 [Microbotryum intermedium]